MEPHAYGFMDSGTWIRTRKEIRKWTHASIDQQYFIMQESVTFIFFGRIGLVHCFHFYFYLIPYVSQITYTLM